MRVKHTSTAWYVQVFTVIISLCKNEGGWTRCYPDPPNLRCSGPHSLPQGYRCKHTVPISVSHNDQLGTRSDISPWLPAHRMMLWAHVRGGAAWAPQSCSFCHSGHPFPGHVLGVLLKLSGVLEMRTSLLFTRETDKGTEMERK